MINVLWSSIAIFCALSTASPANATIAHVESGSPSTITGPTVTKTVTVFEARPKDKRIDNPAVTTAVAMTATLSDFSGSTSLVPRFKPRKGKGKCKGTHKGNKIKKKHHHHDDNTTSTSSDSATATGSGAYATASSEAGMNKCIALISASFGLAVAIVMP